MSIFENDLLLVMSASRSMPKASTLQFPFVVSEVTDEQSINVLNLKTRSSNALKRNGIMTVGGIRENIKQLHKIRNCGETCVAEIKNVLSEYLYDNMDAKQRKAFWQKFVILNNIRGLKVCK